MVQFAEFLEEAQESLKEVVLKQFRPLYNFDPSTSVRRSLATLKRKPFPAQVHAIAAFNQIFQKGDRFAFLVGEMGVGKTIVSLATAHVVGTKTNLIMCPSHLVRKWKREVAITIPHASASIVKSITDFEKVIHHRNPRGHYVILSKERAKLSYSWKASFVTRQAGTHYKYKMFCCPTCGNEIKDKEGIPLTEKDLNIKRLKCNALVQRKKGEVVCGSLLWSANNKKIRRYALAEYIKKRYKNLFDLLIVDEVHEYKAKGSAQGFAAAALASASKRTLALTGTIMGGYSTSLFHLLYRLSQSLKLDFRHNDEMRFAGLYGILERITNYPTDEALEEGNTSKRKTYPTRIVERPGISPAIITRLLDQTVFLRLADIAENLPPYEDVIETVKMGSDQRNIYDTFSKELKEELVRELRKGSKKLLGAYLQSLLAYPDTPWREESIYTVKDQAGKPRKVLVAHAKALSEKKLYPKEKRLIELCKKEKALGRKVGVYCVHTGKRDITGRIKSVLEKAGLKVIVLKSNTVKAEKREDWINQHAKNGIDVLICNPALVKTGLDLLGFPTLAFYQTEYSVYTLRQASRRSWRIGQKKPVRVHYFTYSGTIQEKGLRLVAEKTKASLAVEGEFTDDALSSFGGGDDILTELAKTLVKTGSIGETAESLFRSVRENIFNADRFLETPEVIDLPAQDRFPKKPLKDDVLEESYFTFAESNGQQCFEFV